MSNGSRAAALPITAIASELLEYDPLTGVMRWRVFRRGNAPAGAEAGWIEKGRRRVEIDYKVYLVHRVAYYLHTGEQPPQFLDHRDGDALNNRFANLRPATRRQNNRNKGTYANNTSGHKGVMYRAEMSKYVARIGYNGRKKHLGVFDTLDEAVAAYQSAAKSLYGDFLRQ